LPEPATVRLTCESFASRGTTIPVVGATVQWGGYGLVNGAAGMETRTDNNGVTSVTWTLAFNTAPEQYLTATHSTPRGYVRSVGFTAFRTPTTTTATTCQDAGGTDHGALTVTAGDAVLLAAGSPHRGGTIRLADGAGLYVEAGAVICLSEIDGRVIAEGRSDAMVRFFGTSMPVSPELRHVHVQNAMKVGSVGRPAVVIEDSTFRWTSARDPLACAQVAVSTANGDVRRVLISGYGSQECAALHVSADEIGYYGYPLSIQARIVDSVGDGVVIAGSVGSVSFTNCEVSSSGRHGIVVPVPASAPAEPGGVSVSGCNLFGNGGDAINNQSSITVNASGNWWGDPAGPLGASGDGTSGNVDAGSPSPVPVIISY